MVTDKYSRDIGDWGNLSERTRFTPNLMGTGVASDGYLGMQGMLHNMMGGDMGEGVIEGCNPTSATTTVSIADGWIIVWDTTNLRYVKQQVTSIANVTGLSSAQPFIIITFDGTTLTSAKSATLPDTGVPIAFWQASGSIQDIRTARSVRTKDTEEIVFPLDTILGGKNSTTKLLVKQTDGTNVVIVDTTNNRLGINKVPTKDLDVSGDLNVDTNTDLGGTLGVAGVTTLGADLDMSVFNIRRLAGLEEPGGNTNVTYAWSGRSIATCMAELPAGGGTIYVMEDITEALVTVTKDNIKIVGIGMPEITGRIYINTYSRCTLANLRVTANASQAAVWINGSCNDNTIINCILTNAHATGKAFDATSGAGRGNIINCYMSATLIAFRVSDDYWRISGTYITANNSSETVQLANGASYVTFNGCIIINTNVAGDGIRTDGTYNSINGNTIVAGGTSGVGVVIAAGTTNVAATGNSISSGGAKVTDAGANNLWQTATDSDPLNA